MSTCSLFRRKNTAVEMNNGFNSHHYLVSYVYLKPSLYSQVRIPLWEVRIMTKGNDFTLLDIIQLEKRQSHELLRSAFLISHAVDASR